MQVGRLPADELTTGAAASAFSVLMGDMHIAPALLPGRASALQRAHHQRPLQVAQPAL